MTEANGSGEFATRHKLLLAAGDVFSQKGFQTATVREICARAGTNVAAVNYHFGCKDRLYEAVLEFASQEALEKYPNEAGQTPKSTAEDRLCSFIRNLLLRLFAKGRHAWYDKLMAREMTAPTPIFEDYIKRRFAPGFTILAGIISEIMGPDTDQDAIHLCAQSVIGQCRNFYLSRPLIQRLLPGLSLDENGVETLSEHIARFSLAAVRNYASPQASKHPSTFGASS